MKFLPLLVIFSAVCVFVLCLLLFSKIWRTKNIDENEKVRLLVKPFNAVIMQFDDKLYLSAILFMVLIVPLIFLFPWSLLYWSSIYKSLLIIEFIFVIAMFMVGYFFVICSGVLNFRK